MNSKYPENPTNFSNGGLKENKKVLPPNLMKEAQMRYDTGADILVANTAYTATMKQERLKDTMGGIAQIREEVTKERLEQTPPPIPKDSK